MPYLKCLVFGCSNTSQFSRPKLYAFPKNPQLAKKWLNLCGQANAANIKTRRICSQHFAVNDFEEGLSMSGSSFDKDLKPNCVPTLLLPHKGTFISPEKRKKEQVEDSIVADKKIKVEPVEVEVEPVEVKVKLVEDVQAPALSITCGNQQEKLIPKDNLCKVKFAESKPKISISELQKSSEVDGNSEATFPMVSPPLPVQAWSGPKAPPIQYQVSANQPKPSTSRVSPSVSPPAAVVSTSTTVAEVAMDKNKSKEVALSQAVSSLSNAVSSLSQVCGKPSYSSLEAKVKRNESQIRVLFAMVHSLRERLNNNYY